MPFNHSDRKIPITFLLDIKNNWLEPYIQNFISSSFNEKFDFNILHNHSDILNNSICFILGYTKILDDAFLNKNLLNLVIHESPLPKGKGFAPVQWQILEGLKSISVCIIEATFKVDSGDILLRDEFHLTGYELYDQIRAKQAEATIKIIEKFLAVYPNFSRERQIGTETFYPRRTKNDGQLDINKTIKEQFNLLRLGNNEEWPSFFIYEGKKYILKIFSDFD